MRTLTLHPGRERRILKGHRWVFGNEAADPLHDFEPGSWVEVVSAKGAPLGIGYINPSSLIAVRIVCPPGKKPDEDFFRQALLDAASFRQFLYPGDETCRLVFGESDGLPGLVVDRYADVLVYQAATLGMAKMEQLIRELLCDLFKPSALVFRNDSASRAIEGLGLEKGVASGNLPGEIPVQIDGIRYLVDVLGGQKTGMYLDQRDNRNASRRWMKDKKVLDLFCYNGAWSLSALAGGAAEAVGVDQSADAVEQATGNAELNGFAGRSSFIAANVFDYLKRVPRASFDVIVLDPPAFAKTRSAISEARKGYTDINRRALLALKPGGILITSSCSYHMSEELFQDALISAGQASGRRLRLLLARGQSLDHPVLLAMPETRYLKCFVVEAS
ncbi:MAG: class I SAM-dependent rRNA methyltransferase [Deltaproteobacteria bacterium]|jgi:23S rRNA (cytosine1962-C5)-methyltransferase|nr:class I SAM-dependent rRNA methyltransferase [Deltaproteobacteria bacterium]MDA8307620.1 class I SAM-dependent rRNA methyltransferase [Deltaproteobacteria bacterium]